MMEEKIKEKALKNIADDFNKSSKGTGENLGSCALEISKTTKGLVEICLSPFNMVIWGYDNIKEKFIPLVSKKLRKTPDDNIKTPKTSIAGPTIEALRFASEEPELQNMFANLLATSMDKETASNAHPSFVEIIKQLSPDEARILDYSFQYYTNNKHFNMALIDIWRKKSNNEFQTVLQNFSLIGFSAECVNPLNIPSYINNLCRLGLLEITEGLTLSDEVPYKTIEDSIYVKNYTEQVKTEYNQKTKSRRKMMTVTSFGEKFINSCIKNKDEEELKLDPETSSG